MLSLPHQPSGLCIGPGAVVSGAPPTETGPRGLAWRAILLRAAPESRARARCFGMEEVISVVIAFCSESTFATLGERPLLALSGRSFAKQHSALFPDKWFSSRRLKKIS